MYCIYIPVTFIFQIIYFIVSSEKKKNRYCKSQLTKEIESIENHHCVRTAMDIQWLRRHINSIQFIVCGQCCMPNHSNVMLFFFNLLSWIFETYYNLELKVHKHFICIRLNQHITMIGFPFIFIYIYKLTHCGQYMCNQDL